MKFHLEKINMKKIATSIFLIILLATTVFGQEIPKQSNPPKLVNDYANVLNKEELNSLEGALSSFARQTSTQILVVTVKEIEGSISDFAFRIGEEWGVGQKEHDNGVVIVLKPKQRNSRGEIFVATGYGLEHLIPDAVANKDIVDAEMIPSFKRNDYYGGLVAGINVIVDLSEGEYTAKQYHEKRAEKQSGSPLFFLFFLLFFVIIPIFRGRKGRQYSAGRSLPFWLLMGGMMGSNRSSHSGSFGNFSSGGGGFGGGGFGGFGGGGFGGGGAGGSW